MIEYDVVNGDIDKTTFGVVAFGRCKATNIFSFNCHKKFSTYRLQRTRPVHASERFPSWPIKNSDGKKNKTFVIPSVQDLLLNPCFPSNTPSLYSLMQSAHKQHPICTMKYNKDAASHIDGQYTDREKGLFPPYHSFPHLGCRVVLVNVAHWQSTNGRCGCSSGATK